MNDIQVACFGAANRDIKSQALQEIVIRSSNPVRSESMWGGVARNIAENLARLRIKTTIVSRVGADSWGAGLRSSLDTLGIDTQALTLSLSHLTASYTALLGTDADMFVALADMEIYNELTPEKIEPFMRKLQTIPYWVIDLNLPLESIQYLSEQANEDCVIVTMPVSVAKLTRSAPILSRTHSIVINRLELAYLSQIDPEKEMKRALYSVLAKGVENVIVTNGPHDVILAKKSGEISSFPVEKVAVIDTSGGGDALASGYLFGLMQGESVETSVRYGIEAARLTVATKSTVSCELTRERIIPKTNFEVNWV